MEDGHTTTVTNILHQINVAKPQIRRFKTQIQNRDVTVCMGNTRAGKSTVVNYIQGNALEAFHDSKRSYIRVKDSVHAGPMISHGSVSFTNFPTVWEVSQKMDSMIVDMPGFEDNRGVAHVIVNTLFFNQLKYAKSVKLVLVVDINDIDGDNVRNFTAAIEEVQSVIDDFNELKDAVSVVFTKDCKCYVKEDIALLLKKKLVNVPEIQVKKELIYHLVKHPNSIGILRMPCMEGTVCADEVDCNVIGAVNSGHPVIINADKITFTPSEQAHHVLLDIYQKHLFDMKFYNEVKKCVSRFENYFTIDKYVFASTEEELADTKTQLQFVLPRITTAKVRPFTNLLDVETSLETVSGGLSVGFQDKFNFFRSMDEWSVIDQAIKQIIVDKYKHALLEQEDQINKLIAKIDAEIDDRTKETVQYILSEIASDRNKLIVMSAGFVPLAKKMFATVGVTVPDSLAIEVVSITAGGCGFVGAGAVGVVVGGYAAHYFKTIQSRRTLRIEQGR